MKLINKLGVVMFLAAFSFMLNSCDKTKIYDTTIPESAAHFVKTTSIDYVIDTVNPAPVFNIQVGTTDVSSVDREVTYTVSSPSGAVVGTSYTIGTGAPTGTVTILAGEAVANIPVKPILEAYPLHKRDTLIFTLSEPSTPIAGFKNTFTLYIVGGSCEENVEPNSFLGDYENTSEVFGSGSPYGYITKVSSVEILTPTTAKIGVDNIWDNGWGTVYFIMDFTDVPGTISVIPMAAVPGSNAGDLNPAYEGMGIAIRNHSNGTLGTFDACGEDGTTLTLIMQLGVSDGGNILGYFPSVYTVTMKR